jgi:hypothetical protein
MNCFTKGLVSLISLAVGSIAGIKDFKNTNLTVELNSS